jgi:hypothetical protein
MVVSRGLVAGVVVVALVASGCLGPLQEYQEDFRGQVWEPEQEIVVDSKEFHASLGTIINPGKGKIAGDWKFTLPGDTERLQLEFTWHALTQDYTLVVERPDGEGRYDMESDPSQGVQSWEMEWKEPAAGEYTAYVLGSVVANGDTLRLRAQWEHLLVLGASPVEFHQDGGAVQAILPYRSTGMVSDPVTMDVQTFNGRVEVFSTSQEEATLRVHPWARAATQERAEELARSIKVTMKVEGSSLVAHAEPDQGMRLANQESIGASVQIHVPVQVTGELQSSNGRIVLDDLAMRDLKATTSNGRIVVSGTTSQGLVLESSNGRIMADLRGEDDIQLTTSNGRIELDLVPTGTTSLNVHTSNGRMVYNLKEGASIGYELSTRTSNSKVSNGMGEATWDGDETQGTLRTQGFSDRQIKVTGDVRTSNGTVQFNGK